MIKKEEEEEEEEASNAIKKTMKADGHCRRATCVRKPNPVTADSNKRTASMESTSSTSAA